MSEKSNRSDEANETVADTIDDCGHGDSEPGESPAWKYPMFEREGAGRPDDPSEEDIDESSLDEFLEAQDSLRANWILNHIDGDAEFNLDDGEIELPPEEKLSRVEKILDEGTDLMKLVVVASVMFNLDDLVELITLVT